MAGGRPAAGCCCFVNNVRFPVLILTILCISAIYSTLIVFNLTAILDPEVYVRPVPGLDTLHGSSHQGYNRLKRELPEEPRPPSKVVRFDEDEGHPILPPTQKPIEMSTTEAPTTKKTEKPVPIFITNRPEPTTEPTTTITKRAILTSTTTVTSTTTEENVVLKEVERSLKKLRDAEGGKLEETPEKAPEETFKMQPESISHRIRRGLLYAAPGIGTVFGSFLTINLTRKFGARCVFSLCVAQSAISVILFLYVQKRSYSLLFVVRLIQGALFSSVFPTIGSLLVQWGPLKEQLFFLTAMLMFISVAPFVSWPITSYIHSLELEMDFVYYIQCFVIAFLALLWAIFYRDSPRTHPWVSGVELNKIVAGKVQELQSNRAPSDAFSSLFRSLSAWSIWASSFGFFTAIAFFSTYLPAFLASPDVFMVEGLGFHGILPFMLLPIACLIFSFLNVIFKPSTKIIRIFNTTGFSIAAILQVAIVLVAYLQTKAGLFSILLISLLPLGLSIVTGFARSLTVVGRVFAEQIVSLCAIPFGLAFTVVPFIVTYSVTENKLAEWMKVALVMCVILAAVAIEFAVFGRGRSASWAESSWDPLVASTKMQSLALIDFNQDECGLYELRRIEPSGN